MDEPERLPADLCEEFRRDAQALLAAASEVAAILSDPDTFHDARVESIQMNHHLEGALEAVLNLMDFSYPTHPRIDISRGYTFTTPDFGWTSQVDVLVSWPIEEQGIDVDLE